MYSMFVYVAVLYTVDTLSLGCDAMSFECVNLQLSQ